MAWGTLPDWVSAVGTLGAFAVALMLLARELAERTRRREQDERHQAQLVSAWVIDPPPRGGSVRNVDILHPDDVWIGWRNGSQEPVHRVVVRIYPGFTDTTPIEARWEVWPPDSTGCDAVPMMINPELMVRPPVELSFTDSAGRHWVRSTAGQLERRNTPNEMGC